MNCKGLHQVVDPTKFLKGRFVNKFEKKIWINCLNEINFQVMEILLNGDYDQGAFKWHL